MLMLRKGLVMYLSVWMLLVGVLVPLEGFAMLVPSDGIMQVTTAQASLEAKLVNQRLAELGLSQADIQARMAGLTDEQLHQFAQNLDGLQMGGDVLLILGIVAAVILVLALITGVTHGAGGHHDGHAAVDTGHSTVSHVH
jgi:hypothetical protein